MATTINDALTAIDDYMAKNGKGQSYLAKKFIDLFESKDSPLNVVDGPMKLVADIFEKLGKTIEPLDVSLSSLNIKIRILMATIEPKTFTDLHDGAKSLTAKMAAYEAALVIPSSPRRSRSTSPRLPRSVINILRQISTNTSEIAVDIIRSNRFLQKLTDNSDILNIVSANMLRTLLDIERKIDIGTREAALRPSGGSVDFSTVNKRTNINLFSNNRPRNTNNDNDNKSGIFGKMFKFAMMGTGVYLLGKFKKYLDDTSTGRAIQSILSGTFASILGSITDFVKSKETWGTFGNAALFLIDGIGTIANNIFKYVVEPIAEKIQKTDWGEVTKYLGSKMEWVGKNILMPIFTSISDSLKKDFDSGEYGSLGVKILGTAALLPLLSFIPGVKSLVGAFTSLGAVIGIGGAVQIGTLLYASYTIQKSFSELATAWTHEQDMIKEEANILQNGAWKMSENIKVYADEQEKISKELEKASDAKKYILELQLREKKIREEFEKEKQKHQYIEAKTKTASILRPIEFGQIAQEFNTSNKNMKKLTERFREELKLLKNMQNNSVTPKTKVQDAEIIIPDKKDAHIFAKGGGPFDQALKDVNKKIDVIVAVLSDGFSGLAAVTAQSGGSVAQAVIASAGASKQTPPTIIGGSNPIQRHRINTGRHIEFGQ